MIDRENVIKALGICADKQCFLQYPEEHCPYEKLQGSYEDFCDECTSALAKDTIALLKKQEPRKAEYVGRNGVMSWECPQCKNLLDMFCNGEFVNYCWYCGQKVVF